MPPSSFRPGRSLLCRPDLFLFGLVFVVLTFSCFQLLWLSKGNANSSYDHHLSSLSSSTVPPPHSSANIGNRISSLDTLRKTHEGEPPIVPVISLSKWRPSPTKDRLRSRDSIHGVAAKQLGVKSANEMRIKRDYARLAQRKERESIHHKTANRGSRDCVQDSFDVVEGKRLVFPKWSEGETATKRLHESAQYVWEVTSEHETEPPRTSDNDNNDDNPTFYLMSHALRSPPSSFIHSLSPRLSRENISCRHFPTSCHKA